MITGRSIFLSYSRQQLYFAESLSLRLQKAGLQVWMDLQQLEMGEDWQAQIQGALQACSALVLVASRQALDSPYVEQEWRRALAEGKAVYIALYEAVDLPEALQTVSLVDFRGRFNPAVKTLASCLGHGRAVREPAPPPNRLKIPMRLPPVIGLVTLGQLLAIFLAPPLLVASFPPVFPPFVLWVNALLVSAMLAWWTWGFLQHRFQPQVAVFPFLLPFFIYAMHRMSDAFQNEIGDEFFNEWIVLIGIIALIGLALSWALGPALVRWSAPGEADIQSLRRWFHKPGRRKNRKGALALLNQVLAVRTAQPVGPPALAPPREVQAPAGPEAVGAGTYSLHFARRDRPVAASLRRALRAQKLKEAEHGEGVQILVLSQYLPRKTLQKVLEAPLQKALLLVDNVKMKGDALLEQATCLQIMDYRDRSGKTLAALARTLQDLAVSNLPVSVEITPKSFHETLLPPGARQTGAWVLVMGVYFFLSGVAALGLGLLGRVPLEPLDLPGLLLGPVLIRQGRAFWQRRTTQWVFLPALALAAWLGITVLALAFYLFSFELPSDPFQWILFPSKLLVLNEVLPLVCLLPFTFFLVPFLLFDHLHRYWNWLPAPANQPKGTAYLACLPDKGAGRWVWISWFWGAFLVFGLPLAMYWVYFFLFQVIQFPF